LQISQSPRGIFVNQSKYALESLKKYGFESCDPVDTPMVEKSKLYKDKEGKAVDTLHYRVFANADHAGCQDTRRSTSGSVQFLGERLISWSSKRQKSAAISSTESKYITLSGCCAQILWMRSQLSDYGLGFNKIPMYRDNKSVIALCCNNVQHSRSKHIDIRYHFIKEQVENGVIELYFVNTEYQLVDLFTKSLGRDRIEFLINKLGMRSFMLETLKQLMDEVDECPFFKAFLVTADVPKIYMHEFWATATVHNPAIRFKMDNKKHILDLESFRDILHICPRVHGQPFAEPSFEEEILAFIRFLGHSAVIRTLTDEKQLPSLSPVSEGPEASPKPKASVRRTKSSQTGFVKEQVKVQVSKILSRIEQAINEQLEVEVLTRSSHSSRTSYVVVADLSEMELKKILIEKMEGNKRRDDDADKDEEPSTGPDRGSKRRRKGKEPESASAPTKTATRSADRSSQGSRSRQASASADDQPIVQSSQHPEWFPPQQKSPTPDHFSNFLMNRLRVDILAPELHVGPTYDLMKGLCKILIELKYHLEEVYKATTDQLDWVNPEGQQYPHNLLQPLPLIPDNRGRRVIPFEHFINNDLEYLRGGASSRKYTTSITKTKAADYGHIKDDDKLYKFKEGDFKRLRIQDIKDMLLLLIQGKLTNLTVEELFAFNVSLRMFTRSIVIQRRVEDLQLGVESYQKKLNLTKPDSYRSDLKRKEAYTTYSNPRGFIYQNKDKKNRLMRIDELHKFSDRMLIDVRTALDDRLKGIRM
nr:retrotransposon protein, putative, unclassified [Tanacetum cinerariifolium]